MADIVFGVIRHNSLGEAKIMWEYVQCLGPRSPKPPVAVLGNPALRSDADYSNWDVLLQFLNCTWIVSENSILKTPHKYQSHRSIPGEQAVRDQPYPKCAGNQIGIRRSWKCLSRTSSAVFAVYGRTPSTYKNYSSKLTSNHVGTGWIIFGAHEDNSQHHSQCLRKNLV